MNPKRWLLLILIAVGVAGFVMIRSDGGPGVVPVPRNDVIAFLGDSITAGHGVPRGYGYPELLGARLGAPVINAGADGETSSGGLARVDRDVLAYGPGTVVVFLGGNDMIHRRDVDQSLGNIKAIVERCQAQGAVVVLAGMVDPMRPRAWRNGFQSIAKQTGCLLVADILDEVLGNPARMSDPIHPNAEGHAVIAGRLEPVLREAVTKARAAG